MIILGKRFSEYVEFSKVFLVIIALLGITRLALSLGGVPNATAKFFSMTVAVWIGTVYYALRVHATGFGSYKQLLGIAMIQNLVAQAIAVVGILTSIATGTVNIFSAPEYWIAGGNQWLHVLAHLSVGTVAGSLVPWLIGSFVLFVRRKTAASEPAAKSLA